MVYLSVNMEDCHGNDIPNGINFVMRNLKACKAAGKYFFCDSHVHPGSKTVPLLTRFIHTC